MILRRLLERAGQLTTRALLSPRLRRSGPALSAYVGAYTFAKWLSERPRRKLLRRHVAPGWTVLDVGANGGYYTLLLSRLVGPTGIVHAFEPDPLTYGILQRRVRRLENVTATQAAVADRTATATLYCGLVNRADNRLHPSHSQGEAAEAIEVLQLTLDEHCRQARLDRIDAVKLDVQGAEVLALRGFRETLTRRPPRWILVELSPEHLAGAGSSPEELWELLAGHGYDFWALDDRDVPHRVHTVEELMGRIRGAYIDVWASWVGTNR